MIVRLLCDNELFIRFLPPPSLTQETIFSFEKSTGQAAVLETSFQSLDEDSARDGLSHSGWCWTEEGRDFARWEGRVEGNKSESLSLPACSI
jgi:hypothetical protein